MHRFCRSLVFAAAITAAPAHAQTPGGGLIGMPYAGLSWYLIGFELGPWEQYLIAELTPEMELIDPAPAPHISWVLAVDQALLPEFAAALFRQPQGRASLTFVQEWRQFGSVGAFANGALANGDGRSAFQRRILTSGIAHGVGDNGMVSVSAVLASQQFGYSMLDLREYDGGDGPVFHSAGNWRSYDEVSHGAGLRLAMRGEMFSGLSLEAAIQSRVAMDSFAQYRGVYAQAADLDIPGRAQLGVEVQATERSAFNFAISQVFYSDVNAFPSHALPARFFALLGDSTSPEFAWKDLTVYTVGWRWQHEPAGLAFHLDYSTRSRPEPTAPALAAALDRELSSDAWLAGVSKRVGRRGELQFNAAYAPPEYAFGGNVLGVVTDQLDQTLEVQARLLWTF